MSDRKKSLRKYGIFVVGILAVIICCFVVGFFFSTVFSNFGGVKKNVFWCDLTGGAANGVFEIEFMKENGSVYTRKLKCNKTDYIKVKEPAKICGNFRYGDYGAKIYPEYKINDYDSFEIFLFPERNVEEREKNYFVPEVLENKVVAYFVECWDEGLGKNYYVFSKDNIIEKPEVIFNAENIENLGTEFEKGDFAFYNGNEQKLGGVYNGYVVKSQVDDQFVMLSTLWDL